MNFVHASELLSLFNRKQKNKEEVKKRGVDATGFTSETPRTDAQLGISHAHTLYKSNALYLSAVKCVRVT